MLNERDWRRRNRDRDEEKKKKEKKEFWWENGNDPRTEKESTFYTTPAKGGTIKQEKPEKPDIPTIKDNIETAKTNVNNLTKAHWDTIINGGTDDQIYMAKQDVENAKKEVESLNLQLTEAYGLGPNGYWNNKNPMNEQDRIVHEAGQKPTTSVQPATTTTVKPKPITRPKTVTELDNWVNNPEGYRPQTAATATNPKVMAPVTPRKRVTRVPTTHLDMDIAQMQDELVHNPNMSEQKKWGIEDKITKLSADRDVLRWRRSCTTPPTVEDFEAKKGYIEQQKQFNQDAIVNGLGNGTLKVGSDEWYALQKKGDKLQEQIDAYNRGMMGVLDGEKAVTRSEQAAIGATRSGGYRENVSLFANNDAPMYIGMNDDEEHQPSPLPGPPPVQQDHSDMETYEELLEENSNQEELEPNKIMVKNMQLDEFVNSIGGKESNASSYIRDNMILDEKVNKIGGMDKLVRVEDTNGEKGHNFEPLNYKTVINGGLTELAIDVRDKRQDLIEYLESHGFNSTFIQMQDEYNNLLEQWNQKYNYVNRNNVPYLQDRLLQYIKDYKSLNEEELKIKYLNDTGTDMAYRLMELMGEDEYSKWIYSATPGADTLSAPIEDSGLDTIRYPSDYGDVIISNVKIGLMNDFSNIDDYQLIDSAKRMYEKIDMVNFWLHFPEYLDDNPFLFIFNCAEGMNDSTSRMGMQVDLIDVKGEERAVISLLMPQNGMKDFYQYADRTKFDDEGTALFHKGNGDYVPCNFYYIDKGHVETDVFGYLYFENGDVMFKPNILPNDRFVCYDEDTKEYVDCTQNATKPFVVEGAGAFISSTLEDMGLGLNIPYAYPDSLADYLLAIDEYGN